MRLSTNLTCARLVLTASAFFLGLMLADPQASAQSVFRTTSAFRGLSNSRPAMTPSDLGRHSKVLRLTPAQVDAAKELVATYTTEFEALSKTRREKLREINEEFQESRDFSVMEQMGPIDEKFASDTAAMETTLLSDIRSLLTVEQDAYWPKYERTRRREKTIGDGTLAGESVDLVRIVDDLKLADDARAMLSESLEQYEVDLDRVLAERNKVAEGQDSLFPRPRNGGAFEINMEAIEEHAKQMKEAGGKVRDVNQRYARSIESLLSEDVRPKFLAAVKRASFPQVYRATRTASAFDAALGFDDLDPKQREAINTLSEQYRRDLDAACEKWAQAILDEEKSGAGDARFGGTFISVGDDNEDSPVALASKAKRELEKKSLDGLKTLLTEKQIERLPKREETQNVESTTGGMMIRLGR